MPVSDRTATPEEIAAAYTRQEALLRDEIAALNSELGLVDHKITFGYLGNLSNTRDDRLWFVFLPHPGRTGTAADRLGGFTTGELDGIVSARAALRSFARGARFARSL